MERRGHPRSGAEAIAANTGVWTAVDPGTAAPSVFNGLTRTAGGVLHVTSWLSGFYNQSNNRGIPNAFFRTPSDPRQTSGADQMPQPSDITANTDSINEAIADLEQTLFGIAPALEGRRFVGEPRHSLNLRTRYDFRERMIAGLSVGLGVRMRQGRVAGSRSEYHYPTSAQYTDTANGRVIDQTASVNAADQNVCDAQIGYTFSLLKKRVRWSVQLNVNNLTNQRELVVNNTDPVTLAPVPYRYQDPRQFILTNTFSF